MTISKKLDKKIIKYIEENPIINDWDYREELSTEQIKKILKSDDGLFDLENDIEEMNLDYRWDCEKYFIENNLYEEFKEELTKACLKENPEESEEWIEEKIKDFLNDEYRGHILFDINIKQLVDRTGEIICLIPLYSNYDCTNSFDTLETSDYLKQIYHRVKTAVKKKDFIWEHINGAYGGCLFCFVFRCELSTLMKLKEGLKTAKRVFIPKGTQFGFFSSFQGSGSPFEKITYRNMYLNVKEYGSFKTTEGIKEYMLPDYDHLDIIADCEQHYSIKDVYCCTNDFADTQTILPV